MNWLNLNFSSEKITILKIAKILGKHKVVFENYKNNNNNNNDDDDDDDEEEDNEYVDFV